MYNFVWRMFSYIGNNFYLEEGILISTYHPISDFAIRHCVHPEIYFIFVIQSGWLISYISNKLEIEGQDIVFVKLYCLFQTGIRLYYY